MNRIARALTGIVVIGLLFGCGPAATPSAPDAQKVLNVGFIAPYTGPNALVGQELKAIHTMAFDAIDWTIGDYKIVPVWIDDESDPAKAVTAFKDAILKNDIQVGLSGYHSSVTMALMDVAAPDKIPLMFGQNESGAIVEKYLSDPEKYSIEFKGRPSPTKLIVGYDLSLFQYAIQNGTWKPANQSFSVICEDTDYGRSFCKAFVEMGTNNGWKNVSEDYVALDSTDFYPVLTKVKAADASLLFISMSVPAGTAAAIKQIKETGLQSLVICHGLGWIGGWYEMTGEAGDYILDMMQKFRTPDQLAYQKAFKDKFGIDPSASLSISYDYDNFFIKIAQRALEQYGALNKDTIYKVAHDEVSTGQLTYTGGLWYQELKWTTETMPEMVVGDGYYLDPVVQYFGGNSTIIWPETLKEADLKLRP